MGRVLAVDHGQQRVGLAISDEAGLLAQPLEVLARKQRKGVADEIVAVAHRFGVSEVVVGLPLRMDGSRGAAAEAAERFADVLRERLDVPVRMFDERLSTVEAERRMRSAGVRGQQRRAVVDKVAAAVILRAYLESTRTREIDAAPIPPEPVPVGPRRAAGSDDGGRATAKRRASEKREHRRGGRRTWRRRRDDD